MPSLLDTWVSILCCHAAVAWNSVMYLLLCTCVHASLRQLSFLGYDHLRCAWLPGCLSLWPPWTVTHQASLLCPWNFPGKNTGVSCHALFQGIIPTQGSNPGLPHAGQRIQVDFLSCESPGKPRSPGKHLKQCHPSSLITEILITLVTTAFLLCYSVPLRRSCTALPQLIFSD